MMINASLSPVLQPANRKNTNQYLQSQYKAQPQPQVQFGFIDKSIWNLFLGISTTFWAGVTGAVIGLPTAEYYNRHEPNAVAIQTLEAQNKRTLDKINGLMAQDNGDASIKQELVETMIRHYNVVGEQAMDQDLKTALTFTTLTKENLNDLYTLLQKGELQQWDNPEALFDQFADTILSQKVSAEQVQDAKQLMRQINAEAKASNLKGNVAGKIAIHSAIITSGLFVLGVATNGLPIVLTLAPLYAYASVTKTGMKSKNPNKRPV
jgi:hypothetical protein